MSEQETPQNKTLAEKLNSIPRQFWYLALIVLTSAMLFIQVSIPVMVKKYTSDLFSTLMTIPEGSTIIIQTDWTKSTRGESQPQFEAIMKILMRRNIKFVMYSVADPQAPQVARDALDRINAERKANGEREYKSFEDYIELGYFPNAEATNNAMANNLRTAWAGRVDKKTQKSVFSSPVLEKVNTVADVSLLINFTASATFDIINERLYGKVPLAASVTGVMGPESTNYYLSGQFEGISIGAVGAREMEEMMEKGIHPQGANGMVKATGRKQDPIEGFKGQKNYAIATAYYLSLHVAMALMIIAVIIGNIGTLMMKKNKGAN